MSEEKVNPEIGEIKTQTIVRVIFFRDGRAGITPGWKNILKTHAAIILIRNITYKLGEIEFVEELKVDGDIYLRSVDEDLDKVMKKLFEEMKKKTNEVIEKIKGANELVSELRDKYGFDVEVEIRDV